MPAHLNRVLQVRALERLRARLTRDEPTGLPTIGALSPGDVQELREVGGGCLAAVAIRAQPHGLVLAGTPDPMRDSQALAVREVARLVHEHVRRMDLLGLLREDTLLVLAPGLDEVDGRNLAERLLRLLSGRRYELPGMAEHLRVEVGAGFRSADSPSGWSLHELAAEAESNARSLPIRSVA